VCKKNRNFFCGCVPIAGNALNALLFTACHKRRQAKIKAWRRLMGCIGKRVSS